MFSILRLFVILLSINGLKSDPVSISCNCSDNSVTSRCDVWEGLRIYYEDQEIIIQNAENCPNATAFSVDGKVVPYFPSGIDKSFANLKALQIKKSGLKKISSRNLQNLTELEHLDLSCNKIESLEENLFKFNKNLSVILLNSNKIQEVDPTAFDGLTEITTLELIDNLCISENGVNNDQFQIILSNLKTKCWSESLDIKKFILEVTKMDNGVTAMRKLMNCSTNLFMDSLNHENSSPKADLFGYDSSKMSCICKSSSYELNSGILHSKAFYGMSIMDMLIILNTLLLSIVTITILTSKCTSKSQNNQNQYFAQNQIYKEIFKAPNSLKRNPNKSLKSFRSMELPGMNYHENDECYDEISVAVCQEEYAKVLNSEGCEAIPIEDEELYSEVGCSKETKEYPETTEDPQIRDKESCDKEAMYTEVIKRSSGWI
ncbi:hypothetical protein ACKWTF_014153 [Chironomus riparius]